MGRSMDAGRAPLFCDTGLAHRIERRARAWAAIGGNRPVVAVTGDGGFGQFAMELTTAVKYGLGIKHVLLDNHALGKIA